MAPSTAQPPLPSPRRPLGPLEINKAPSPPSGGGTPPPESVAALPWADGGHLAAHSRPVDVQPPSDVTTYSDDDEAGAPSPTASVGGVPLPAAAAGVAAGPPPKGTAAHQRRHPSLRLPPHAGRPVAAAVDAEIDALEGAGWWVCSPSPTALVRAASEDASADAALCF
ncbi:hypothetical protein I4F81_008391 [Pyropia yezoensis]|uniref:Uncharacterized protein n=1 Tax=Pyropia yezoensis TaxID=2788 RepID=A0ACC3C716_PYRYE|nr:hypothetical protein I4F81_008391 [Neopyropia yezoensis]